MNRKNRSVIYTRERERDLCFSECGFALEMDTMGFTARETEIEIEAGIVLGGPGIQSNNDNNN